MGRKPPAAAWFAAAASLLVAAAQAARLPSPLQDAATGAFLPRYALEIPWGHLATTPFSALADWVTTNSARQDKVLGAYLLLGYWLARLGALRAARARPKPAREAALYGVYLGGVAVFLAWALLCPRPPARLGLPDPDLLALDFHSHTRFSHDGRRAFTPEANMAWHREAGFGAAFITDHNTVEGARLAKEASRGAFRSLLGEEVSLQDTHVGVLGNRETIDNRPYDGSPEGVRRFLRGCRAKYGGLPVLNLPEYWLHHSDDLEELAGSGAAGIEIVNAVPKALDFPEEDLRRAIDLARRKGLFLAGSSDNHGWGRANYVWSVLRVPGQAGMSAQRLEAAVLETLRRERFGAVQVVRRVKWQPRPGAALALDPLLGLWTLIRTWSGAQALAALAWIWAAAGASLCRRI